ncbi:hypothetical protein [Cellulomonas sp. URHE0023]|uniref:hypothetical protein n=1 Tax=Cellulomonas sp. URHE0023 TaxID=1380354 RepID=UPI000486F568|nr:hypothetical protein [Cellulomonas sp. URHE0023]
MSVPPEGPVADRTPVSFSPGTPRWTTGATALLLGILTIALLAVGAFAGLVAALAGFGGTSEAEANLWTTAAVVAVVLGAGCAIGAVATAVFALVHGRERTLATTGLVLGVLPVVGVAVVVLFSVS